MTFCQTVVVKQSIVILSAFLSPYRSGAEAMVEEVALKLSDRYEITIITSRLALTSPRHDMLGEKVKVRRVGLGLGFGFDKFLFPFLAPFAAKRLKPAIIHAVLESYAGLALVFCAKIVPGAKRMLTLQSTNTSLLLGLIHRAPHVITAISSALIRRAKNYGRSDITLIPNGIPLQAIQQACRKYPKVQGRILFVGRLEKMKGVDVLLEAFSLIIAQNRHLRIVGDGSQRKYLEDFAHRWGVATRVTFLGRLDQPLVLREYAEAEVFCGLSRSEAFGNVFIEAQAAGCAVLAARVGGIPDIVHDGVDGVLVEPDAPQVTAEVLGQLLNDTALRQRLSEAGKQGKEKYDWAVIAGHYGQLYEAVMTNVH